MDHHDNIHAERLYPDSDFEYRIGTSRYFQRQTARAGGLSDKDVQRYRESMTDSRKGWTRYFDGARIVGHDTCDFLVSLLKDDHVQQYSGLIAEANNEYHVLKESWVEQVVDTKFARPTQGLFQAQIEKPVATKLQEVILERSSEAFRKGSVIEGADARSIKIERDIRNGRKVQGILVPFYDMTAGILGEDETHYLFLDPGESARWVAKEHITVGWAVPYEQHKAGLIAAFQFHRGSKQDFQGSFRPDIWFHGDSALFLAVLHKVLQASRSEFGSRHPALSVDG